MCKLSNRIDEVTGTKGLTIEKKMKNVTKKMSNWKYWVTEKNGITKINGVTRKIGETEKKE